MLYLPDCGGCMSAVTADAPVFYEGPFGGPTDTHGEVLDVDGESTCEWVNEDCPSKCHTEHDEPYPDDDGTWECPETGDRFRYCTHCGWEPMGLWDSDPVEVNGNWLCDPSEHGWMSCEDCGEYVSENQVRWFEGEYDGAYLCNDCYNTAAAEQSAGRAGDPLVTCGQCGTANTFMDEYTETFVCSCSAEALRKQKRPVLAAA